MVAFSAEVMDCRLQGQKTGLGGLCLGEHMGTAAGCRQSGVCHIHSPVAAVCEVAWVLCAWAAVSYLQQERSTLSDAGQVSNAVAALRCGKLLNLKLNPKVGCTLQGLNIVRKQMLLAGLALCAAGAAALDRACTSDLDPLTTQGGWSHAWRHQQQCTQGPHVLAATPCEPLVKNRTSIYLT